MWDMDDNEITSLHDAMQDLASVINTLGVTAAFAVSAWVDGLGEVIQSVMPGIYKAVAAFERELWWRWESESLFEWGARLNRTGMMDNPDVRWEYQKYVLATPWRIARGWFRQDGE